jgi:hypothetical protein
MRPQGEALAELIDAQVLNANIKAALVACLTRRESRRWTVGELFDRLKTLGMRCSKPALAGALVELQIETDSTHTRRQTFTDERRFDRIAAPAPHKNLQKICQRCRPGSCSIH